MEATLEDWEPYCSYVEVASLATGVRVNLTVIMKLLSTIWHVHTTQSEECSPAFDWKREA
jgi:hypothetical protein